MILNRQATRASCLPPKIRQPLDELYAALDQLDVACDRNDIARIRRILIEQQTAYTRGCFLR